MNKTFHNRIVMQARLPLPEAQGTAGFLLHNCIIYKFDRFIMLLPELKTFIIAVFYFL